MYLFTFSTLSVRELLLSACLTIKHYKDLFGKYTGAVVVHSPRRPSSLLTDNSSSSSSTFTYLEDSSTIGTMVLHGHYDDSDSSQKFKLGVQERSSSASSEDSSLNLAEAKAAIQAKLKKVNL